MRRDTHVSEAGRLVFVVAFLIASCTGDEPPAPPATATPQPSTLRIAADPPLLEEALAAANDLAAARGLTAETTASSEEADLIVTAARAPLGGTAFVTRYWVVAVGLPDRGRGLSMSELADVVSGHPADWSTLIAGDLPVRVLTPIEPSPPIDQWWPGLSDVAVPLPLAGIPAALNADAGALALMPLDAAGPGVRTVAVDGVNVVFGKGDARAYPLVERATVVVRAAERGEFRRLLEEVARGIAERLDVAVPDPIILRATGDIIPARCVYAKQRDFGDFRHAFLELGPWLAGADIAVGSLDASVSDAGAPIGCVETFNLLAPAASVEGLAFSGFDVMTVATNHVKDCGGSVCGDQAFFDTLADLRAGGIEPVGGGADLLEARRPAILTVDGVRFAFLGYDEIAPYYHAGPASPGTASLDESYVREDVAAAREQADVVVVLPHWGVEYTADPTFRQRSLAATAVEAGANLIIGNHPHWVQAAEVIDGAFVAYALGNFVFDQDWSVPTQQGAVLEVAFHGTRLKGVEYYPIRVGPDYQPVSASAAEASQILDRIWTASAALD